MHKEQTPSEIFSKSIINNVNIKIKSTAQIIKILDSQKIYCMGDLLTRYNKVKCLEKLTAPTFTLYHIHYMEWSPLLAPIPKEWFSKIVNCPKSQLNLYSMPNSVYLGHHEISTDITRVTSNSYLQL